MTTNKCKGCGATVDAGAAIESFETHDAVYCIDCRCKIDAGESLPNDESATDENTHQQTCDVGEYKHKSTQMHEDTPLDMETIKKYICTNATDKEAYAFMQLCKARNLNPFTKEAYLLKYKKDGPVTMVVGKDAFTHRAEDNPAFDGFEAGIIVKQELEGGAVVMDEWRHGTFLEEGEILLGGWAKVYMKDHAYPVIARVSLSEYMQYSSKTGKPNKTWTKMPATMIRKVALVQSLRESFPSDLGGCYDSSEMGADI